jgi:hypothetical protein
MASKDYDWQNKKEWQYKGGNNPLKDPKYIKDRNELFNLNGHGWWWGWKLVNPKVRPIDLWDGEKFDPRRDKQL